MYKKRIVKKKKKNLDRKKLYSRKKLTKKKKKNHIRRHLWLGNTCAVSVIPGGCSQASKAMITIMEPKGMHSTTITSWSDMSSLALKLLYGLCH